MNTMRLYQGEKNGIFVTCIGIKRVNNTVFLNVIRYQGPNP